eukprot:GCRY01002402.1.p1 GENE.GCRY01002402.1~~GCRY01002402.1.p1  ORF type:complete len:424 (+),score=64.65 GCRY01002402.1:278-1549(+)
MKEKKPLISSENEDKEPFLVNESRISSDSTVFGFTVQRYNVVLMGICFFFLFIAFNTTQSLETTLNKQLGFNSLAILYTCFSLTNFFSPAIIKHIGPRAGLILGAIGYTAYIAGNIKINDTVFLINSGFCGCGASLIWTAQGTMLSRCSNEHTIGINSSLFFGIFMFHSFTGYFASGVLINSGFSNQQLFTVLTIAACCGTLSFFFLRKVKNTGDSVVRSGVKEMVQETLRMLCHKEILLLFPFMLFSGLEQTYFYGTVPPLIGKHHSGYVLAIFGVADTLFSLGSGHVAERIGRIFVVFASVFVASVGFVFVWAAQHADNLVYYYVAMVCFGASDGLVQTQVMSILGLLFEDKAEAAYATFKLCQSSMTGLGFAVLHKWDFHVQTLIVAGFGVLGFFLTLLLHTAVHPLRKPQNDHELKDDV